MKWLLSSDLEGFDGPFGVLLQRLYSRRKEIRERLRQIVANLGEGNLTGSSEHNRWTGNRCVPLIDDYVVVFTVEESTEGGELIRHIYLLALEVEKQRH
jgi:hypothetical protein